MATPRPTAFDRDFERDMRDPTFRNSYEQARGRIDAIDRVIRDLDAVRERQGVSKAELARRIGVSDSVIRRLFSADDRNPTMRTIIEVAEALGLEVRISRPAKTPRAS